MREIRRILAICNTPFQIIVVARLREIFYGDACFDVLISDQMVGHEVLVQRALETNFFTHVQGIRTRTFVFNSTSHGRTVDRIGRIFQFLTRERLLRRYYEGSLQYDELLTFNVDRFTELLFECIVHHVPHVRVCLFEEGAPCYQHFAIAYTSSQRRWQQRRLACRIADRCLGRHYIFHAMRRVYAFMPEMIHEIFPFESVRIPQLNVKDTTLNEVLFHIFSYDDSVDQYDGKVIFFEESLDWDGQVMDYDALLGPFVKAVGKEHITVKRHPRSQNAYFEAAQFRVNHSQSIPWELVVLKHPELASKLWVGVCSGSMICPYYYEGIHYQCVSLVDIISFLPSMAQRTYFRFVKEKLMVPHPEVFFLPKSEAQLNEWLALHFCK